MTLKEHILSNQLIRAQRCDKERGIIESNFLDGAYFGMEIAFTEVQRVIEERVDEVLKVINTAHLFQDIQDAKLVASTLTNLRNQLEELEETL